MARVRPVVARLARGGNVDALVIQRSEHRDTQAIQAKLDELLRVHNAARSDLTRLDEKEPEEIENEREGDRRGD